MKRGLFVGALVIAAMDVFAATVALPPPPPCDYADTEASTNLAFSLRTEGREFFEVAISLAASASNNALGEQLSVGFVPAGFCVRLL